MMRAPRPGGPAGRRRTAQPIAALLAISLLAASGPASTQDGALTRQDALIVVRAVLMLIPRPQPDAPIVLVHDGTRSSRAAAEASATLLGGLQSNAVVAEAGAPDLGAAAALVLMPGLSDAAAKALPPDKLTIATDDACLRRQSCILLVRTQRQVSIVINRRAFERSNLRLDPSFQVLLKEG